ncbi:MAG: protein kinase [Pyrinomonadaceae bacterium]|nr:protein kinase [Pyrinomonadaceae bacterium]
MYKCPQCQNVTSERVEVCAKCGFSLANDVNETLLNLGVDETQATRILSDKSMTPEKWRKIKDLFIAVQEKPIEKRGEFLENACGGDQDLKNEVEELLGSYSEDDEFLETPAVGEVASMFADEGSRARNQSGENSDGSRLNKGSNLAERYRIIKLLGKGGMGEVYLGTDIKLDRKVALKVLPAGLTENKERLQRFEQEARAVSALNHPYILTIFEFGNSEDGSHFIATEYVEGQTLDDYGLGRRLELSEVLKIAMQVSSALSAAHELGITHRDIKPENIMVRPDGYVKVLDFGLAKLTGQSETTDPDSEATTKALVNTNPGSVMGTAAYMSPEQARGVEVDGRTDIWSLGVVMYELITGHKPFRGDTSTDTIISVIKKEPPPIISYVPNVPSELVWIISKMLSKELDGRYQTAKELRADLAKIKKHVEFQDDIERSTSPEQSAEDLDREQPTKMHERIPTAAQDVHSTLGVNTQVSKYPEAKTESSLEYAVTQVRSRKLLSAIVAAVLIGSIAAFSYFVFYGSFGPGAIDSIAVLPFENRSADEDLKYLSDGISESLIDRLSGISQLRVIARNSSFKFRGENIDIRDVSEKLGVRAVIMGSIMQRGDDLTIRVEVIDAVENKQLWGERYNRKAKDLLTIQNEIAQMVSEKLSLKLSNEEEKRLANGGTENSEAYRQYLNGLVELKGPKDVSSNAINYFQKAVELDPNFALAHAEIALIYTDRALGAGDPRKLIPKARAATQRALEIDDKLAKPYLALAMLKEFEFDWPGAEREYRRAIELNPSLDLARNRYSFYLSTMGRHSEALEQNRLLQMRDPVNLRLMLLFKANNLMTARRFDEALEVHKEAEKLNTSGKIPHFAIGLVYAGKGSYKKASEEFREAVENLGGDDIYSLPLVYLGAAYAKMPEKRGEALSILKKLESMDGYVSPAIIAVLQTALDDKDGAMRSLEKAYDERDVQLRFIGVGYEYDGLRDDPRFQKLLKQIGLSDAEK